MRKWKKIEVILELLIFGIVVGVIEDLVAIYFATGETITWSIVGIAILVTVPFAILGEVIFDNIDFASILERLFSRKKNKEKEGS